MGSTENLDHWDDDLSIEAVVSKLLHMQPSEENYIKGYEWITNIIDNEKAETAKEGA